MKNILLAATAALFSFAAAAQNGHGKAVPAAAQPVKPTNVQKEAYKDQTEAQRNTYKAQQDAREDADKLQDEKARAARSPGNNNGYGRKVK